MNISFSKDYGTVNLSINDDQDVEKCQKLERLMNSPDFSPLLELFAAVEQKYDEVVMKVKPQEQSFRETAIYAARKNGFCECVSLLRKSVEAYNLYKEEKRKDIHAQINEMLGKEEIYVDQ